MGNMERKIVRCVDCDELTDPKEYGSHYEVLGWVEQRRSTGGANNIRWKRPTSRILCEACSQKRILGIKDQDSLF